jgi:hypothetical protein
MRQARSAGKPEWLRVEAVPAMLQLLMHEDVSLRMMLIEFLAEIPEKPATTALAQRAVFDVAPEAREAAIAALRGRRADDYRPVLVKALTYPWPPAADHAAETLVALDDQAAVSHLVGLLDRSDPAEPQPPRRGVRPVINEVVRAHHLTNCLLCHPPGITGSEPILGLDPVVTVAQPVVARTAGGAGGHNYGARPAPVPAVVRGPNPTAGVTTPTVRVPAMIRGDITYLRQDFSVQLPMPVALPQLGPLGAPRQRFDFVVRTRLATPAERARLKEQGYTTDYPQREAVLFALRELTGRDPGPTTAAWRKLYPLAPYLVEADRLRRRLLDASPLQRQIFLGTLRDAPGLAATLALATAIPELDGTPQSETREVLAARLARSPADELRSLLRHEDEEVRRAAILAATRNQETSLASDLIALLEDRESPTAQHAEDGLKLLTGLHFASASEWREWMKQGERQD